MPGHPPDDLFEDRDIKLWRDFTRMYEDYAGNDCSVWPERQVTFSRIVRRALEPITPVWDGDYPIRKHLFRPSQANPDYCRYCDHERHDHRGVAVDALSEEEGGGGEREREVNEASGIHA